MSGYRRRALQGENGLCFHFHDLEELTIIKRQPPHRVLTLLMPLCHNFNNKYTIFKLCKPLIGGIIMRASFQMQLTNIIALPQITQKCVQ